MIFGFLNPSWHLIYRHHQTKTWRNVSWYTSNYQKDFLKLNWKGSLLTWIWNVLLYDRQIQGYMLIVMGDMNVKVNNDRDGEIDGKFGLGRREKNGISTWNCVIILMKKPWPSHKIMAHASGSQIVRLGQWYALKDA